MQWHLQRQATGQEPTDLLLPSPDGPDTRGIAGNTPNQVMLTLHILGPVIVSFNEKVYVQPIVCMT